MVGFTGVRVEANRADVHSLGQALESRGSNMTDRGTGPRTGSRYDYESEARELLNLASKNYTLQDLADRIVEHIQDQTDAENIALYLESENMYVPVSSRGVQKSGLKHLDIRLDPDDLKTTRATFPWAEMVFPLETREESVGWLLLGRKRDRTPFDREDEDFLNFWKVASTVRLRGVSLREEKIRLEKMRVVTQFSAFLLHDVKNLAQLLRLISVNAENVRDDPELSKEFYTETLKDIKHANVRAEKILELVSLATGNVHAREESFDLKAFLEELVHGFPEQARTKLRLKAPRSVIVRGDRNLLTRAMENLLWNAYDALLEGTGGRIWVKLAKMGQKALITVQDDGPGVRPEVLPRMFIPFQTTKQDGLGLGLYQAKVFVEANRGTIEVESKEGEGATFLIRLPATKQEVNDEEQSPDH
jgi:signal transduction histidine kinase